MCGIAGFLGEGAHQLLESAIQRMADSLTHRGPNDRGLWIDTEYGIALGHRRLSILDLSSHGHQPMVSACGRYVLVFNGEIYNHLELRQELEKALLPSSASYRYSWRGHSDTETLLAAFSRWGVKKALQRAVGMFAIGLWDRETHTLILARDRLGEKPLYYGWQGSVFLFGSELKALRVHPAFNTEINRGSLCMLLRSSCIPAPYTIYQGIHKLMPGALLTLQRGSWEWHIENYWSLQETVDAGAKKPFFGSETDGIAELEKRLLAAVAGQMVADVPLGAFLSGGVDSSTIVALMQAVSSRPINTFTIGFCDDDYNEAKYANAVARHLGTDHTELHIAAADAIAVIPQMPTIYDEPFSDSSQIPTFLVAQLAKQHVTVSLSGDGGDELFGGYNRHVAIDRLWRKVKRLPWPVRRTLGAALHALPPSLLERLGPHLFRNIPQPAEKIRKVAELISASSPEAVYQQFISHWKSPTAVVIGGVEPPIMNRDRHYLEALLPEIEQRMMFLDTMSYLPDDILVKVDRAAMAVSLETRVPFLDHRVVEFAWQLPLAMKIRGGQGKRILRQVLYKYVPKELIE